jgi:glycosyltransferase involved in cell wall biosynthesis
MTLPLVSVITPVYNGERFLEAALKSLFAQGYAAFESIVVDDGSTDKTADIARSFPKITYIHQENQGRAAACNTGAAAARGELIAWLDSDDLLPTDKLSIQAGYLADNPGVGGVLGKQTVMLEDFDAPQWMKEEAERSVSSEVPFVSLMVRAEALAAAGGFDPSFRYAEDRDLLVRLRERGTTIEVLDHVVLHRRYHGSNMVLVDTETKHPLLRSLKAKVDRSRSAGPRGEAP